MRLKGVRAELCDVASLAAQRIAEEMPRVKFFITEGLRTKERQEQLYAAGSTWTMNSRHLTGHAFDFALTVNGKVRWDWPLFAKAGEIVKGVAEDLGVRIVWGGDWKKVRRDGPHVELDRKFYP
jgi:peptidoglycan L-alanyl-D-glutamate endopeptidase CwlK